MRARFLSIAQLALMTVVGHGQDLPADLIRGLSSERFKEREKSEAKLIEWVESHGDQTVKAVHALVIGSEDPEIRQRCADILKELSDRDYLTDGKGYVGIIMAEERVAVDGDEEPRFGIRIQHVVDDSPAGEAGLQRNDLIVALDGKKWKDAGAMEDFMEKIAGMKPLRKIVLTIVRGEEKPEEITFRLGRRPLEELNGIGGNLELLDKRAKEKHFRKWLEARGLRRW